MGWILIIEARYLISGRERAMVVEYLPNIDGELRQNNFFIFNEI